MHKEGTHSGRNRRHRRVPFAHRAGPPPPPGSLDVPPGAPASRLRVMRYGPDHLSEEQLEGALPDTLQATTAPGEVLWIDVTGVGDRAIFEGLGARFGLHPLALEDVVHLHQRPKAEDYGSHAYVVLQMPAPAGELLFEQVSLFVGPSFVITVQEREGDCLDPVRARLREGRGRVRGAGADYLAYTLIDTLIDSFFPIVEGLNTRLEALEEEVARGRGDQAVRELQPIRHELHALRRALASTREAVGLLIRGDVGPIADETRLFLRDCQDHTAQLLDAIEACRELSADLIDLHLSSASHQLNEVMKVLTLISTIFIPMSFVTGLYGMNFDPEASPWNMPELAWRWGYPAALGGMGLLALSFLLFFYRRGWLGRRP